MYHQLTVAGDVGDITKFTSPLKLFDYLSAGKIIICSILNILKEIIKENINAIFVKNYTNPYSWKNEIQKLKNQPSKQLIISKNNYKLSKNYSLNQRAKKILEGINLN
jgi:glycosyltransferase involved in cell wall biosynthesis